MALILGNCRCGIPLRRKGAVYCSKGCYNRNRFKIVVVECVHCHEEFNTTEYKQGKGRRFCSQKCKSKNQRKQ